MDIPSSAFNYKFLQNLGIIPVKLYLRALANYLHIDIENQNCPKSDSKMVNAVWRTARGGKTQRGETPSH